MGAERNNHNRRIKGKRYFEFYNSKVWVIADVDLPCPQNGQGYPGSDIFPWGTAYLCKFLIKPFGVLRAFGFRVSADPEEELHRRHRDPPQRVGDGWGDTALFYHDDNERVAKEKAVLGRIQDLQEILEETSLKITCRSCESREECIKQIQSLLTGAPQTSQTSPTPSFFSY